MREASQNNKTLLQPRAGIPILKDHIVLLQYLQDEGGADILPTTIDSYTRQNRYKEAQLGIEESLKEGRYLLNGFPAVNYGVKACREIIESVKVPVEVRHGTQMQDFLLRLLWLQVLHLLKGRNYLQYSLC